jgi:hypothetical protein
MMKIPTHAYRRIILFAMMAIPLLCAIPAQADDTSVEVFVSAAGNDATGNGSIGNPYATVDKGIGAIGDNTGTVFLLPGEYLNDLIFIIGGQRSPGKTLTLASYYGNQSTTLKSLDWSRPIIKVSTPDIVIKGLRFAETNASAIVLGLDADNVRIENCIFDGTLTDYAGVPSIVTERHEGTRVDHIDIRGNTFLGTRYAALSLQGDAHFVHFLKNTVHMTSSARGVIVDAADYSGVIIDNNIFNYGAPPQNPFVLYFQGNGQGTRVNLNCFSADPPATGWGIKPANKLATKTVAGLALPFRDFAHAALPGESLRGTCMDIYSQEYLGALKQSAYVQ